MHRRSTIALLLASLLVLAGCTGTTGPATTAAEPETTATQTATATLTPEPTPEPAVTPGAIDAEAVADRHAAALREAGSFTMRTNVSFDGINESSAAGAFARLFSMSGTARVDLEAGRSRSITGFEHPSMPTTDTYIDAERGMTYRRTVNGEGNVTYHTMEYVPGALGNGTGADAKQITGGALVERWLTTLNFTVVGVEEIDGRQITRLEAEGAEAHSGMNGGLSAWNESDYESIRTTMLIDEAGVVREMRQETVVNASGKTMSTTVTMRWTDVGSTTVEEPDWLEEAQNATAGTTAAETEATATETETTG